jgi:hypothetical protein
MHTCGLSLHSIISTTLDAMARALHCAHGGSPQASDKPDVLTPQTRAWVVGVRRSREAESFCARMSTATDRWMTMSDNATLVQRVRTLRPTRSALFFLLLTRAQSHGKPSLFVV